MYFKACPSNGSLRSDDPIHLADGPVNGPRPNMEHILNHNKTFLLSNHGNKAGRGGFCPPHPELGGILESSYLPQSPRGIKNWTPNSFNRVWVSLFCPTPAFYIFVPKIKIKGRKLCCFNRLLFNFFIKKLIFKAITKNKNKHVSLI
jgi:hypothetical protein